jgi:hypothetical protein
MRGSEPDDVHLDCPTLTADEVTGAVYGARPGDEHDHRHTTNGSSPHRADNVQRLPNAPTNGSAPDDVYLDVPTLRVHEVKFELDDLRARVSLDAAVLKLLTLHVGADVELGRVKLTIRGVEAQAQLRVRLDNVAEILGRVMTTIDRNPQILEHLLADVGTAVKSIGTGTGQALEHVGAGADRAIGEIGRGAGSAVQDVGRGAGSAVQDVGRGAGSAVHDVGSGAASAVQDVAASTGATVEKLGHATASATGELGAAAPIVTQAEREGDAEHHVDRP